MFGFMTPNQTPQEAPLQSWKEIAAHLQRDTTTVQRWEKEEGLPVHRHTHKSRSSVYAYTSEIDSWRASRKVVTEPAPRSLWRFPAFALTMLLCLIMVGNGTRPVSAQQRNALKTNRQVWVTNSEAPASISPDGRYMSYTDATGDLGVRDLKTKTSRRLTHDRENAFVDTSVLSSDSRQIAYVSSGKDHAELRIIPTAGGSPRVIWRSEADRGSVTPLSWAPDSKHLLVLHYLPDRTTRQLGLISIADGSIRTLKELRRGWTITANLSPDGRWIVYDAPADEATAAKDIFVLSIDGGREVAIVQNPADDSRPLWSPDGSRVLFQSNRTGQQSLWSVPFEAGRAGVAQLVRAGLDATSMWITKDGTLYYLPPRREAAPGIYRVELDADGKASKPPALAVDRFTGANAPALSPDGQYLAFASSLAGLVIIHDLKTGGERAVPTQSQLVLGRWFRGQQAVLAVNKAQGPKSTEPKYFYRFDLSSGKTETLFSTPGTMPGEDLSPDGKTIFFPESASEGRGARLVRFDIASHTEKELLKGVEIVSIAISPDGKQLGYIASGYVAVIPAEGGESREVFRAAPWPESSIRHRALAWTSDGRYLVFARRSGDGSGREVLVRVRASGGPAEQITAPMLGVIRFPMIQPDGRGILFAWNPVSPVEVWALENFLPKSGR
jgi:Tol biopolymer transport system component